MTTSTPPITPAPHSWLDDIQGFVIGANLVALGVILLTANGLMTGGTAGLAFLLHYLSGGPVGLMFVLANLPFFALAWWRMGWVFALKSVVAVVFIGLLIHLLPIWLELGAVHPAYSALGGGLMIGMGALAFVRHGASVGGANILAVYMQQRHGIRAGAVQMGLDIGILAASVLVLDFRTLLYSIFGAAVMGAVLAWNHRPGRYMGL
ncbi:MAG: YitT family protein [Oceanococcaceae bacterium]